MEVVEPSRSWSAPPSVLTVTLKLIAPEPDQARCNVLPDFTPEIVVLRAHADESLTLINRSGDDASEADFKLAERQLGPGPGTFLSQARAAGTGSPGYARAVAAGNAATARRSKPVPTPEPPTVTTQTFSPGR